MLSQSAKNKLVEQYNQLIESDTHEDELVLVGIQLTLELLEIKIEGIDFE